MKKIICLLYSLVQTQTFSAWITDSAHPTLQVRWATKKDANNYSYLQVEIKTAVCSKFTKDFGGGIKITDPLQ